VITLTIAHIKTTGREALLIPVGGMTFFLFSTIWESDRADSTVLSASIITTVIILATANGQPKKSNAITRDRITT